MADRLTEFIATRLTELSAEEERLRDRLAEIAKEKESLKRAEQAAKDDEELSKRTIRSGRYVTRRIKPNTIMDTVLKILRESPRGLIALDILAKINLNRDQPIERTSLSPQLSRLKQGGFIELEGSTWKLSTQLMEKK
jgi:hypothetical protein